MLPKKIHSLPFVLDCILTFVALNAIQDLVARPQIEYLHLIFRDSCKSSLVVWIKLDVEDLLAEVVLGDDCLFIEARSCITKLYLSFIGEEEFVFRLW